VRGFQCFSNDAEHAIRVAQYVVIPEAQQPVTARGKPRIATLVASATGVLTAIGFDDQVQIEADEVDNERANGLLAPELRPVQLA
jgi:hypothetical protein